MQSDQRHAGIFGGFPIAHWRRGVPLLRPHRNPPGFGPLGFLVGLLLDILLCIVLTIVLALLFWVIGNIFFVGVTVLNYFELVLNFFLMLTSKFLAQMNSVPRITRLAGITMKAGPGRIIIAIPMRRTLKPIMAMTSLLACLRLLMKKIFI
jgi:hypothetical protein